MATAQLPPRNMPSTAKEKPLSQAIKERRATGHFESTPVPDADLQKILQAGLEAPSGYNLQPWRFVVVRDPEQRKRLRQAAFGQPKVEEAPVILVACGDTRGWDKGELNVDAVMKMAGEHGYGGEKEHEAGKHAVRNFLGAMPGAAGGIRPDLAVWVNRHVTIAAATIMWMAECLGYDTAPMEGFDEDAVRKLLHIPDSVRVVMLLAIGRRKGEDKPYGGRFPVDKLAFDNDWGKGLKL